MSQKYCIGCFVKVEKPESNLGVGAICIECKFPYDRIPDSVMRELSCQNCGIKTNLIGAAILRSSPSPHAAVLYFDCPSSSCKDRRMHLVVFGQVRVIPKRK